MVLPHKTVNLETLEFSGDERELYDSFEKKAKIRISKFIRERSIIKKYALANLPATHIF